MLFFRGRDWDCGMSNERLRQSMERVTAWFEELEKQGRVKGGQPLDGTGRRVARDITVTDGPFVESKEAVGGYLLLEARDIDEAAAIARSCPMLDFGITVEVRPTLEECPVFRRARERMAPVLV